MSDFPSSFTTPEDAYRGFFRADSAKNAPAWAACMSYPHVRVSAIGSMVRYETAQEYADAADWASREATGWVKSEGVEPKRIQETDLKVHLAGGWTRFNADDEPILENRVMYTCTRINDSWGIQARFGTDSYTGKQEESAERAATELVAQFIDNLGNNKTEQCAKLCRYPLTVVRIGDVVSATHESHVAEMLAGYTDRHVRARKIQPVLTGARGVLVEFETETDDGSIERGIVLAANDAEVWRIAATSHIDR